MTSSATSRRVLGYGTEQHLEHLLQHEPPDNGFALLQLLLPIGEFLGNLCTGNKKQEAYIDGLVYIFDNHQADLVKRLGKTLWRQLRGKMAHQLLKSKNVKLDTSLKGAFEYCVGVPGYDQQARVATINPTAFTQFHLNALEKLVVDLQTNPSKSDLERFRKYITKGGTPCQSP